MIVAVPAVAQNDLFKTPCSEGGLADGPEVRVAVCNGNRTTVGIVVFGNIGTDSRLREQLVEAQARQPIPTKDHEGANVHLYVDWDGMTVHSLANAIASAMGWTAEVDSDVGARALPSGTWHKSWRKLRKRGVTLVDGSSVLLIPDRERKTVIAQMR